MGALARDWPDRSFQTHHSDLAYLLGEFVVMAGSSCLRIQPMVGLTVRRTETRAQDSAAYKRSAARARGRER